MRLFVLVALAACAEPTHKLNPDGGGRDLSAGNDLAQPGDGAVDLARSDGRFDLAPPTWALGGVVSGLTGTLVLTSSGMDVTVTMNGAFSFPNRLRSGTAYGVSVKSYPAGQLCTVANGQGTIGSADVTNVMVTCVAGHTVGGAVTGLAGGSLVLRNNGEDLTLSAEGSFTFPTPVAEGAAYTVSIQTQPTGQRCDPLSQSGTMAAADVLLSWSCRKLRVRIDEVYARPATGAYGDTNGDGIRDSGDDEFIELVNAETSDVDLSGWAIRTSAAVGAKLTFPSGSVLASGQRAVVFGGGTPTGSFGGARVFVASLSLTDAPAAGATFTVELDSQVSGGVVVDSFSWDNSAFGSSCTKTCASQVFASPSPSPSFVPHPSPGGANHAGILWSPGVPAPSAIPKLEGAFSTPRAGATNVSVLTPIAVQYNLYMDTNTFSSSTVKLYKSTCALPTLEQSPAIAAGPDPTSLLLTPAAPLSYNQTYCIAVEPGLTSALGVPLAPESYPFTTRAAASVPGTNVVISEFGGCRLANSTGLNACTASSGPANDEFVELYNPTSVAKDISNWQIQRRTGSGTATCWATLPDAQTIQPHGYYLVAGGGFDPSHYAGAPQWDYNPVSPAPYPTPSPSPSSLGTSINGGSESIVLKMPGGSCTDSSNVIDTASAGTISDTLAALQLPGFGASGLVSGQSLERKACFDSTGDADVSTGMFAGGGQELTGNREHFGASNADFILRASPNPQNSTSPVENALCPQ